MAHQPDSVLLVRARMALRYSSRELAEQIETSDRTLSRMLAGQTGVPHEGLAKLAGQVYPIDRALAAEILAYLGQTLISAGLEGPSALRAPAPAPSAAAPAKPSPALLRDVVDAIVCAAAEAADVSPKVVRPTVLMTLRRALESGIDLKAAADAGLLAGVESPKT